ncbi:hypothetical protein V8E55_008484 [Tylopilus felleus]
MSAATAQSVAGGAESPAEDRNVNAITNRNLATLAVFKELPVTHVIVDGQVHYQKKYLSTTFDVPKPDANIGPGPFYLITRGCRVGIFSSIQHANPHIQGVSLASHSHISSFDEALLDMANAILHSKVSMVGIGDNQ